MNLMLPSPPLVDWGALPSRAFSLPPSAVRFPLPLFSLSLAVVVSGPEVIAISPAVRELKPGATCTLCVSQPALCPQG